jgi:hypothetical protein
VQLRAGEGPDGFGGGVGIEAQGPVRGKGVDERAEVSEPVIVEPPEELRKLRLAGGRAADERDKRRGTLEALHDVGREEAELLALIRDPGESAGRRLLGHRPRIVAAHGALDELAEERALVPECRIGSARSSSWASRSRRLAQLPERGCATGRP